MYKFLLLLASSLFFFSCSCGRPLVLEDPQDVDHLTLKNDCYSLEYNNLRGGTVKEISYHGHALISALEDSYPGEENNYRLSLAHTIDDGESILSSTFHRQPKLTMNRSYVILDEGQGVKLKWVMKNTGSVPFLGKRWL